MKIALLSSGILPIPAVQGGAVENLVDFYLEYNELHHLHDITIYSVRGNMTKDYPLHTSFFNHYHYIDTTSLLARTKRFFYKYLHHHEYYNYFIEYFFEEAYKDIRKKQYDCIILENRPGYAYKLAKRGIRNLVLHLHNDLLNHKTPHHKDILHSLSLIITVSDYIKNRVLTIEESNKVTTVYNGIDLTHFSKKDELSVNRKLLGLKSDDCVLVFSGRINKDKGIAELIEAMLLLKDLPKIKLLILGSTFFGNTNNDDSFVRSLKSKALPIQEKIIFTGYIPYNIMPDYLQLANIAIIPSVWEEPFGLTCAEALSCGLPIITTNRGGLPEVVGDDNAIVLCPQTDFPVKLASAIKCLYNSPKQRQQLAQASILRSKYFDKERYEKEFFETLENMNHESNM